METLFRFLKVFFDDPVSEMNVKQISSRSGLAYGTCYNYANELAGEGFFSARKVGAALVLKANLSHPELVKYFEILELRRATAFFERHRREYAMLAKVLEGLCGIEIAAVFGSFAREQHVSSSDIDLLLVGGNSRLKQQAISRCSDFGITKGREINPVFASFAEFVRGMLKKEGFYKNLWDDRVLLKGERLWWKIISEGGVSRES